MGSAPSPSISFTLPPSLLFSHGNWFTACGTFVYNISKYANVYRGHCLTVGERETAHLGRAEVKVNSDVWLTLRMLAWTHSLKSLWTQKCLCMPIPWAHPSSFPAPLRAAEMVGRWRNLRFQDWGRKTQDELGISFSLRKSSGKNKQKQNRTKQDGNLSEKSQKPAWLFSSVPSWGWCCH